MQIDCKIDYNTQTHKFTHLENRGAFICLNALGILLIKCIEQLLPGIICGRVIG